MDNRIKNNLLTGLENISAGAAGCGLDFSSIKGKTGYIKNVSSFLGTTKNQTIFFSILADLSLQSLVTLENMASHIGCSILKLLTYMHELEALEARGYIKRKHGDNDNKNSYNDMGFKVPHNIIEALRTNDSSKLQTTSRCQLPEFLIRIANLVNDRGEESISTLQLYEGAKSMITNNRHLTYVKYIDTSLRDINSKITMFALGFARLKGQINVNIESFASALFDDLGEQLKYNQQIIAGTHELIARGMLRVEISEFMDEKVMTMNGSPSIILFEAYPDLLTDKAKRDDIIRHADIRVKKLFYPDSTNEQLRPFEMLIRKTRFKTYRKELRNNNLTAGITAIFHGAPGKGKTEAVYQLAKKSGRNIMMVDLSQTKSKWLGESEKVVKKIFDDYSALLANSAIEPILFINEGDGLFTRRVELGNRGSTADLAINTMQNIMLQELERFEGILITTTNLTGNLDRAFERRLTFKILFPVPDIHARTQIWKNKVPELTPVQASILAKKFNITGGEIDIRVRHLLMKKVLNKNINIFRALEESCTNTIGLEKTKKVGF